MQRRLPCLLVVLTAGAACGHGRSATVEAIAATHANFGRCERLANGLQGAWREGTDLRDMKGAIATYQAAHSVDVAVAEGVGLQVARQAVAAAQSASDPDVRAALVELFAQQETTCNLLKPGPYSLVTFGAAHAEAHQKYQAALSRLSVLVPMGTADWAVPTALVAPVEQERSRLEALEAEKQATAARAADAERDRQRDVESANVEVAFASEEADRRNVEAAEVRREVQAETSRQYLEDLQRLAAEEERARRERERQDREALAARQRSLEEVRRQAAASWAEWWPPHRAEFAEVQRRGAAVVAAWKLVGLDGALAEVSALREAAAAAEALGAQSPDRSATQGLESAAAEILASADQCAARHLVACAGTLDSALRGYTQELAIVR